MARYNKSGLTVDEAKAIFNKCIDRGGHPIKITEGRYFGNWVIGSVGTNNAFYLFQEVGGKVNVAFSTNPKTGISKKLLGLAQKYGFIEGNPNESVSTKMLPNNSKLKILSSVVLKMLPLFNNCCSFAEPNPNGTVDREDLKKCPTFQMNNADFHLVSLYYDKDAIRIKYANDTGLISTLKLS